MQVVRQPNLPNIFEQLNLRKLKLSFLYITTQKMATIVGSNYYDRGMMFYLQCPNAVEEESMPLSIIELLELANAIENDCIDTYIDTSSKVLTQWINGTDSVLTLREFIQAYKEHITP